MQSIDRSIKTKLVETQDLVTNFYTYEGVVKALNKVSLVVNHGCSFGLVGESGCGKSVLVRSLLRIVQQPGRIEQGKILLFLDQDHCSAAVDLLRQSEAYMESLRGDEISMIFQEPNASLNPLMKIGDQIAESFLFHRQAEMTAKILERLDSARPPGFFPFRICERFLYGRLQRHPESRLLRLLSALPILKNWNRRLEKEALERSIEMLRQLSIPNPEGVVKRYAHNLSGGMKQRILIAMALACHPSLLIADEATSNLDVTIQAQILDLLRDLKTSRISSILFITHDLGIVAETCDRVGVMYAGNICEVADVRDLFGRPRHPYTQALLDSVPKFSQEGELLSIEGNVPNLVNPPAGCRFHPRCNSAKEICGRERPELREVAPDHWVACHSGTLI